MSATDLGLDNDLGELGSSKQLPERSFSPTASVVLVGSRGSGKRSLGFIGATHLGRRLITEDHYFQEATGISRGEFLRQHGLQEFCRRNIDVLRQMLERNKTGCIIECGMGSFASEAQKTIREYSKSNPVIYILREREKIRCLLNLEDSDAFRLERGDLSHRNCSNMEYYNLYDSSCEDLNYDDSSGSNVASRLKYAKEDFSTFLDFVTGQKLVRGGYKSPYSITALPQEFRSFTYALSIRLSSISELDLEELEAGADAVQLKIDFLLPDFETTIAKQVATIRRKLGVPIIYYIEENAFEGTESSLSGRVDAYFRILEYGLRLGVEYIVVNLKYPTHRVIRLVQCSGHTKVIGHYDQEENTGGWDDESRVLQYTKAKSLGCNLVRFVRRTSKESDNNTVRAFLKKIQSIPNHLPVIAYNIGKFGRPSLIENRIFTPVTHPIMLSSTVGLGKICQLLPTAADAMKELYTTSVLNPLHFYHLGASVFYSLSPAMHNTAYQVCGMSNDFQSLQVSSLQDIHRLCQESNFGGAAITQPFKVAVLSMVAAISNHAKAIGAANTLLPLRKLPGNTLPTNNTESLLQQANRRNVAGTVYAYYGDNTDFIGILNCLRRNMTPRNFVQPSKTTGLVIGAGGMARAAIYAMIQLGCQKIFLYNRTVKNAETVACHFNLWAGPCNNGQMVRVLSSNQAAWPSNFQLPTMIISCVPSISVGGQPPANFEMPLQWLGSPTGGVVMDLSYLPLDTPLLRQVRRVREKTKQAWVIVDGLEVLPEQAIAQFELMTGRRAPKKRIRLEVRQNYHKYDAEGLDGT